MERKKYKLCSGIIATLIIILTLQFSYGLDDSGNKLPVRHPAVADAFYPGDPLKLKETVQLYLDNAGKPVIDGELKALMAPHAGYVYSGQVAAYSYKELIDRHYETVILIGPSHFYRINGAAVFTKGYYASPLGNVPVNQQIAEKIVSKKQDILDLAAAHNTREHCLEVQLPFLQTSLKGFSVVPILVGQVDEEFCRSLAGTIVKAIENQNALIVVSTDLSHYPSYSIANSVDQEMLKLVIQMKPESIHPTAENLINQYRTKELHTCMCGEWALITTMFAVKELGANATRLLKYANSGDVPLGKKNSVVGYGAVAFYKKSE